MEKLVKSHQVNSFCGGFYLFGTTVQSSAQCADCLQANKNSLPGSTLVERRPYFRLLSLKNSSYTFAEIEFHLVAKFQITNHC